MTEKQIEKRIARLKELLAGLGEMRPGSLSKQKRGDRKVYHQLSYTYANRGRTEYIRQEHVKEVRKQISNYAKFKKWTNEWVALGIELSKLKMKSVRESEE